MWRSLRLGQIVRSTILISFVGLSFGIIMAIVSNAFIQGVRAIAGWRGSSDLFLISIAGFSIPLLPLISLMIAACLIIVVRRQFGIKRFHGPADAIYAAHRSDNELDVKSGFGSTFAAFLSASGGASVGQYGPLVHFGATLGSVVRQHTNVRLTTDVFIGCGVAGAIAAGFNAPIAAIVFAHEVILRHFSLRAAAPIAIASISASGFSSWAFGGDRLFQIEAVPVPLLLLLPAALLCGPFFGLLASLYMYAVRSTQRFTAKSKLTMVQQISIAVLGMGIIGTMMPVLFGFGITEILRMLSGEFSVSMLIAMLIGKILLTALCLGFGLFGGVFSPALFVGAAGGSIAHRLFLLCGLSIPAPALVTCGMAAVGSAVIGAPISGVLIMLELTMSYEYALGAMLSVVLSALVAYQLFGMSFFDKQLHDRGIDIAQGRGHLQVMETYIKPLVSNDYLRLDKDVTVGAAIGKLASEGTSEAYILGANDKFIGKVSLHELLLAPETARIADHLMASPLSIKADASLLQSIELASDFVGEHIPVIDSDTNILIGILTEADLFQAYLDLQTRIVDLERR